MSSASFSQSKNFSKHRYVFSSKNNYTSNKCLKISEPIARKEIDKQKRLCFLCLEKGHSAVSCKLKYSCNKCGGKHNIAICTFSKDKTNPSPPVSMTVPKLLQIFLLTKTTSFFKQRQFLSVVSTTIT